MTEMPTSSLLPDAWRREVEYFESVRAELCADPELNGKFVAVQNRQIVDRDADEFALAQRVDSHYPRVVVLIARVQPEPPVVRLPSPRLLR